jgi:hypothetical protein
MVEKPVINLSKITSYFSDRIFLACNSKVKINRERQPTYCVIVREFKYMCLFVIRLVFSAQVILQLGMSRTEHYSNQNHSRSPLSPGKYKNKATLRTGMQSSRLLRNE